MAYYICTWIYCDSKDEESSYTQTGNNSADPQFQAVYWRCVYVYFCTSIKNNPGMNHILFTNCDKIPTIDGVDLALAFKKLKVQIVKLPLTFQSPQGYFSSWRNQFYIFDILGYIGETYASDDCFVILDSDCVWVRPADELMRAIALKQIVHYPMPFEEREEIHGLTRLQMKGIYEELLSRSVPTVPRYSGGEWFGATGSYIQRLNNETGEAWKHSIERFHSGKPKFNEEAHMLSYLYYKLGIHGGEANTYIRRIWTISSIRRDVETSDMGLAVWHCPSEKKYGIARLYDYIREHNDDFWRLSIGASYINYIGRYFGIPSEEDRYYPVEKEIRRQIEILESTSKEIVIFGSGKYGAMVLKLLQESGIQPRCFIDNDPQKWRGDVDGIPVLGIDSLHESDFVVIASYASAEIKEQLIRYKDLVEERDFIIYQF